MWWIPALIGGALSIAGRLTARARRKAAVNQAIEQGSQNLREGQLLSAQNASQLAQDNLYVLSLSGVSANEGTASQLQNQIKLQSTATINKMSRDFDNYVANLQAQDNADALNTAFSVAGDIFGTVGRLTYDNARVNGFNASQDYPTVPQLESPEYSPNWITPLGRERMKSIGINKGDING